MLKEDGIFLDEHHELYNSLVPKNHKLRKLLDLTDFSFIYDELKNNYCLNNGKNATSPILLFKYLLLKIIYKLSDVDVVERSMYDLSFKYFLSMNPMETNLINPATLSKFRKKRLIDSDLLDKLIIESIKIAKEHNLIDSKTLIVDATHTCSRYNAKSQRQILIEESKFLRKTVYQFNEEIKEKFPKKVTNGLLEDHLEYCDELITVIENEEKLMMIPVISERLNYLKEILEDNLEHLKLSYDDEARIGHKTADSNFYGYKTHITITEERLITAATVTTGEKHDGKELKKLIEKSKKAGIEVEEVLGDGAYSESDNLIYAKENSIKLISKLSKTVTDGNRESNSGFYLNKDADMYVCPDGHMAKRKSKTKVKSHGRKYPVITYYFDIEKCKHCSKREGCYKDGAKSKSFTISLKRDEFKEHMKFMKTDYFKKRSKERYKIEAQNANLKNNYRYRISNSRGLFGMEIQAATTLFVSNLNRILVLNG